MPAVLLHRNTTRSSVTIAHDADDVDCSVDDVHSALTLVFDSSDHSTLPSQTDDTDEP